MSQLARVGVLVGAKGRGSNMEALVLACRAGIVPNAEVVRVVSPAEDCPALEVARGLGVETMVVGYDPLALCDAFRDMDVVCLAGYLKLVPPMLLTDHPRRVLNIHPALLPKFGGKGMFGLHVHAAVLAAGEKESGCTVHYVTEQYDEGQIILQRRCEVKEDDSPSSLAARVLRQEHLAYAAALARVLHDG